MADSTTPLLEYGAGYLVGGCDSYTLPDALLDTEYVAGMNVVNRGGVIQTRPGTRSIVDIVRDAVRVQGFTSFTPTGGVPQLVAAIDGRIWVSPAPFTAARLLPQLQFNPTSKFIIFESCLKSSDYTADGQLFFLEHPYNVLMIQDGATRAAFWDGNNARHLNPSPSNHFDANGDILTVDGFDETFIGLFMKWSGNRLWVERNGMVFASDFGNPMKFTEARYINEGRAFYLTGECTGMIETPEQDGLLVFTADNSTLFQTNIQDRNLWLTTPNFQKIVFANIGCVAPFSLVKQYGLIWWFSSMGMINTDQALSLNRTSRMDFQDNEMMCSKANIGPDMTGICTAAFENYLLVSVPSGDVKNKHTWCLDQAVLEDGTKAWNSFWTGWFPVQWASAKINGHERIFFISKDSTGCVKIWEANQPDRTDNGAPITCWVQTKNQNFGDLKSFKRFIRAEVYGYEILDDVSVAVAVSGRKGGFYKILNKEIVATKGAVYADQIYDINTCFEGLRPQTRVINTQETNNPGDCNVCGIESLYPNDIDQAFALLVLWSGRFGFTGFGMFAKHYGDPPAGDCEIDEVGPNSLTERGCSDKSNFVIRCPFPVFDGAGSTTIFCPRSKVEITQYATATSIISQSDADRKARHLARLRAEQECTCSQFVWINTIQRFTAYCPGDILTPPVTIFIKAGEFRSTVSQAAADAAAQAAAQAQAEAALVCPPTDNFRVFEGSESNSLSGDDDSDRIILDFMACFNNTPFSEIWVNTNGNLTFDGPNGSPSADNLVTTTFNILAGLWTDWLILPDKPIKYGTGILGGHKAMAATWRNNEAFGGSEEITNSMQIVLIDRSDLAIGFFDVEMNYKKIQWPDAGAGVGYRGFQYPGTDIANYYLDTNLETGLIHNNSGVPFDGDVRQGRYTYQFRGVCAVD